MTPIFFEVTLNDNFDYETLDDLINGILTNEEIIGYIIHIDVLPLHSVALHAGVDLIQLSELTLRLLRRGYLQNLDMFPLRHTLGLQNISKFDPSTAQEQIMPLSEAKGANAGENIKSCSGKSKKKNRQPDSDSKVISQKIQPTQGYHSKTLDAIFPRRILAVGVTTFVDRTAEIAPNARLVGACFIGPGCRISQNCLLVDCIIGPG
ncbi:unnamed protein product [Protopolystoma xenopodis]|uniref:Uncharacterized protein n=1 Tax=Protopolystoma xenopodis TaxID=117903 RepID=A0A448X309_9PLAT|nr:unnamed protein product [Protopolystoma xenopodis]